ncbi:hypothetical protein [Chitinolyticbacter albus]|uniref:hypothetical protein n=1 Tax=Chitinolyticbacter albus TaxID=2961951 RepID=UPI00210D46F9|nr:hypothetical protein [Chitinolyticbacter albus]
MFYVLDVSDDYPEDITVIYDRTRSPRVKYFYEGDSRPLAGETAFFSVESEGDPFVFDYLPGGPGLFSIKFIDCVKALCDDIDIIKSEINHNGKIIKSHSAILIKNSISCIDMEKSNTYKMLPSDPTSPTVISNRVFKDSELDGVHIARSSEDPYGTIVISKELIVAIKKTNPKGITYKPNGKYE